MIYVITILVNAASASIAKQALRHKHNIQVEFFAICHK